MLCRLITIAKVIQERFSNMSIFTYYPKIAYKVDDYNFLQAIDITIVNKIKKCINIENNCDKNKYIKNGGDNEINNNIIYNYLEYYKNKYNKYLKYCKIIL